MSPKEPEFKKFLTLRMIGGVVIIVVVLWALGVILGFVEGPDTGSRLAMNTGISHEEDNASGVVATHGKTGHQQDAATASGTEEGKGHETTAVSHKDDKKGREAATDSHGVDGKGHDAAAVSHTEDGKGHKTAAGSQTEDMKSHDAVRAGKDNGHQSSDTGAGDDHSVAERIQKTREAHKQAAKEQTPIHTADSAVSEHEKKPIHKIRGVGFVEACIKPIKHELEERRWGWRPNDILDFTDNVNNYQLGVLEVTRRTTVALAERISRTGTTDAYNRHLELAMNWFMIKADRYWFPSPESKYRDGLEELGKYMENLQNGEARFHTRTDNLIPLLSSFEDLLGSCDENLVKQFEADGSPVSWFTADDYFYYAKGVAESMLTVLEAIHHDFLLTLESRHATELLHHAIEACKRAAEIEPWIIMDRKLESIIANHRANMAAPISHARFYIGAVIKTLST